MAPMRPLRLLVACRYLLAQLSWQGLVEIIGYIAFAVLVYIVYGYSHSVGNSTGWFALLSKHPAKVTNGTEVCLCAALLLAYPRLSRSFVDGDFVPAGLAGARGRQPREYQ